MAVPVSPVLSSPITARFTRPIRAIADIEAPERLPYDSPAPVARNLFHPFDATARLHRGRPALTLVSVAVDAHDQDLAKALTESPATLPQTYRIVPRPS
jgi:hypothetical protein